MQAQLRQRMDDFLDDNLWMLAWGASVQRVRLYARDVLPQQKTRFSDMLHNALRRELLPLYRSVVSEADHCAHIEYMKEKAENDGGSVLHKGRYRYSSAQKLLNLYLKYQWCLGHVAEPPHCPVDRIVLSMTALRNKANWTDIESRSEYLRLIEAIRQQANKEGVSIARWELLHYRRRR